MYPKVIEKRINQELPFITSETIIVEMVKHGANRQVLIYEHIISEVVCVVMLWAHTCTCSVTHVAFPYTWYPAK